MRLLERQSFLDELVRRRVLAESGHGQVVFVCGEAGIGKSALLNEFFGMREDPVLRGYCDPLTTPSALGPISDIWAQLGTIAGERSRERLFTELYARLQQCPTLTLVAIEDLHWADEATLDFIRYLGRRIAHTRCLLIATFRDDEVGALHPLSRAIGDLTGNHVSRLELSPLSLAAVTSLARETGREAQRVFAITGGNPFFVRELLSAPIGCVPATVRDSMLARLARCSESARELSEHVALSPGRMDRELLSTILGDVERAADEAIERGILIRERSALAYRHELARRAVQDSLPPRCARELHARILAALLEGNADLGRLVHHARMANDSACVLKFAPQAARRSATVGAHREAVAYYSAALEYADNIEPAARVQLYEQHAYECYLTSQIELAVQSAMRALEIWRELGDRQAEGRTLRFLSRQYWFLGDGGNAKRHALEAIAILEAFPPGRDLAMAYSNRAQLAMLSGAVEEAIEFGERAIKIAHEIGDREIECHALNNIGTAMYSTEDAHGRVLLERSLALAIKHDLHEHAARAYVNLASTSTVRQDVERAEKYLRDGTAYCEERDLDSWTTYHKVYQARFDLDRGKYASAENLATGLISSRISNAITRIPALVVLAQARMRRGDLDVSALLDEALESALPTRELQRIGRVCAARAEYAWYRRELENVAREADLGLKYAEGHRDAWIRGELLWHKSRVCAIAESQGIADGYRYAIAKQWSRAAEEFERASMPFEQTLMLLHGGPDEIARAQAIIDRIQARVLRAELDAALSAASARRGTISNSHGLTRREVQVLELLGQGLTNAELANKLCVSAKTIDHHVSAILSKLQVRSRAHAVTAAHELGLLGKNSR